MFKRQIVEQAGINWEDANEFNKYLSDLKKETVEEIRVEGDLLKSKLAWKISTYSQAMRYRIIELADSCIDQWHTEKFVSCFILARSITETISILYHFEIHLEEALVKNDLDTVDNIVMNRTFSTRLQDLFDNRVNLQAVNILTIIDRIDKEINGIRIDYDRLSEYAHANYFGVSNAYARIDYNTGDTLFKSTHYNKKDVFERLIGVLGLLAVAKLTFEKLELQIKLTAELQSFEDN